MPNVDVHPRVRRLTKSFSQCLIFGVSRERLSHPNRFLLPYALTTPCKKVELTQMLNRCDHGITKMVSTSEIPLLDNIKPNVSTTLAWDIDIDRLEKRLSGEVTWHRLNEIEMQSTNFGLQLPQKPSTQLVNKKEKCRGTGCRASCHLH